MQSVKQLKIKQQTNKLMNQQSNKQFIRWNNKSMNLSIHKQSKQ
jgi:hypothetical protein